MNDLAVILEIVDAWAEDRSSNREILEALAEDRSFTLYQTPTPTGN